MLLASPLSAQEAPPSVQDFKLEPAPKPAVDPRLQGPGLTPRPTPLPSQRTPSGPPPQRPSATDQAAPAPATPRPRAAETDTAPASRPRPAPSARPAPPPAARSDRPARTAPSAAEPENLPAADPGEPQPLPETDTALQPQATAAPTPQPTADAPLPTGEPSRWPLLLFALAGVAVLGAASVAWRRRSRRGPALRRPLASQPVPSDVTPVPPAAPPARKPSAALPSATETGEPLTVAFEPLDARATALGTTLNCRMTLTNHGVVTATGLSLGLAMAGAGPEGDAQLAHWLADGSGDGRVALDDLAPGESRTVERSLRVGARDFRPIQLADRAIFVPLVGVDLTGALGDETVRVSAAHVVGRSPKAGGKMGPFRVDQGPRHYRELGQRPHALAG